MPQLISIPSEPTKVYGDECNNWINKKIGFASHVGVSGLQDLHSNGLNSFQRDSFSAKAQSDMYQLQVGSSGYCFNTTLLGWNHDDTKRKIGLVLKHYDDGGLKVAILSTDVINNAYGSSNLDLIDNNLRYSAAQHYVRVSTDPSIDNGYKIDTENPFPSYPNVKSDNIANYNPTYADCRLEIRTEFDHYASYDEFLNFDPIQYMSEGYNGLLGNNWTIGGEDITGVGAFQLTTDKTTTFIFGDGYEITLPDVFPVANAYLNNPLYLLSGNMYNFIRGEVNLDFYSLVPSRFFTFEEMEDYVNATGRILFETNFTSIPYNLILTESESEALQYLSTGELPNDAWLYPLDWENFPSYTAPDDDGTDGDDDNNDGDNDRDIDENLPSKPDFTPSMLSNYNWYWLTASQFEDFIRWFWYDIGEIDDLQDILDKIQGYYSNLAETILMVRYFPVDIRWIGGAGTPSNIKLAMLEKAGSYTTISTYNSPDIQEIGHVHIDSKYNSFVDLSPYSVVSIYLPFHGFVDLDINLLSGHDLYVKAVYDHLTGTILYLLYYDNKMLINSFICKMAVDIPITLQTKNDRDSAIFSNVSNSISGLLGAGMSFATGNPIGLMVGANAFNSGVSTAPLNVKGTIGETGAFYSPDQCYIIVRRPTISKPESWKYHVGQVCGKTYTLANLTSKGLTICYNPRVNFTKTIPLQSEIDEIYSYLEEGVIL